jgi:hypothetical protein
MRRADIEVPNRAAAVSARARSACYPRGNFYPLISGAPTRTPRVTRPAFRLRLRGCSRGQAPFWPCPRQVISDHLEGTLGRLRYFLGGDRPSQTPHLPRSPWGVSGFRVSGWYSTVARRLPPILYRNTEDAMAGWSEAPRGLSVLSRVAGIFTGTTISPSLPLRQRPSRYAFRAGRNLPD